MKNYTPKQVIGIVLLCVFACVGFSSLVISEMYITHQYKLMDKNGVRLADSVRIAWLERDLKNRTSELIDLQKGWAEENVSARYKDSVGYKQMLETKFKDWFYSSRANQSALMEWQNKLTRKYEGIASNYRDSVAYKRMLENKHKSLHRSFVEHGKMIEAQYQSKK